MSKAMQIAGLLCNLRFLGIIVSDCTTHLQYYQQPNSNTSTLCLRNKRANLIIHDTWRYIYVYSRGADKFVQFCYSASAHFRESCLCPFMLSWLCISDSTTSTQCIACRCPGTCRLYDIFSTSAALDATLRPTLFENSLINWKTLYLFCWLSWWMELTKLRMNYIISLAAFYGQVK